MHGLSCPAVYGIFPDKGSNPCPLHQQADSQPLDHQGSLSFPYLSSDLWFRCGISVVGRSLFSDKIASAFKREKGVTEKLWVEERRGGREKGRMKVIRKEKRKKDKRKGRSGEGGGGERKEGPRL